MCKGEYVYKQENGELRTEVQNVILERNKRIMNIIVPYCSALITIFNSSYERFFLYERVW
jgi:hypothetical protein